MDKLENWSVQMRCTLLRRNRRNILKSFGRYEILALSCSQRHNSNNNGNSRNIQEDLKSDAVKTICDFMKVAVGKADISKRYGVTEYLTSITLSVKAAYRGQKLGVHMLDARYCYLVDHFVSKESHGN